MPGGKNPYTRPANKPERAAMKRQSARNKLKSELRDERARLRDDTSVSNKDYQSDATNIGRLLMNLDDSRGAREDRLTSDNAKAKEARRRDQMYAMKSGGKMKKMKMGGKCRGMGAATRGGNFYKDG